MCLWIMAPWVSKRAPILAQIVLRPHTRTPHCSSIALPMGYGSPLINSVMQGHHLLVQE